MPYRRTENVARRLAARHDAIIDGGAGDRERRRHGRGSDRRPWRARAGIAAGTVYRYFPGKTDLVAALLEEMADAKSPRCAAPRALRPVRSRRFRQRSRRLRCARCATAGLPSRRSPSRLTPNSTPSASHIARRLQPNSRRASAPPIAGNHLPEQDAGLTAAALTGLLVEGLIGPLAPDAAGREREIVQSQTLLALRALGVADARARGLVVQTAMPAAAGGA